MVAAGVALHRLPPRRPRRHARFCAACRSTASCSEPLGWHRVSEVEGERGETIWYICGPGTLARPARGADADGELRPVPGRPPPCRVRGAVAARRRRARGVARGHGAAIESGPRSTRTCPATTRSSSTTRTGSSSRSSTSPATRPENVASHVHRDHRDEADPSVEPRPGSRTPAPATPRRRRAETRSTAAGRQAMRLDRAFQHASRRRARCRSPATPSSRCLAASSEIVFALIWSRERRRSNADAGFVDHDRRARPSAT